MTRSCILLLAALVIGLTLPGASYAVGHTADAAVPAVEAVDTEPADEFADEFDDEIGSERLDYADPLEPLNRGSLGFNRKLDHWVLNPITDVYRFVVPDPVRHSLRRFLSNLDSSVVLANDLMQREWNDAGVTAARFGINTSVGVLGLFDPAANRFGIEGHFSDFGQTMALEGVPSGPYIVVPVLGPTTVRDGLGDIIDLVFRPVTFILGPAEQLFYATIHGGSSGLATRDAFADELAMLEESSIDYYAALRNAYSQSRNAEIWARRDDHSSLTEMASEYWPEGEAGVVHAAVEQ